MQSIFKFSTSGIHPLILSIETLTNLCNLRLQYYESKSINTFKPPPTSANLFSKLIAPKPPTQNSLHHRQIVSKRLLQNSRFNFKHFYISKTCILQTFSNHVQRNHPRDTSTLADFQPCLLSIRQIFARKKMASGSTR